MFSLAPNAVVLATIRPDLLSRYDPDATDPSALARRIAGLRQGCLVLILSPHRPLSAADRTWLVDKCRTWAARLDDHLAAVESGRDPLVVRGEVDERDTQGEGQYIGAFDDQGLGAVGAGHQLPPEDWVGPRSTIRAGAPSDPPVCTPGDVEPGRRPRFVFRSRGHR